MAEIVCEHQVGYWVAKRVKGRYHEADSWAIGLTRNGAVCAGVIYENWNRKSVTCHIAIDGRMTPAYVAVIFDYAFNVLAVSKVICPVAAVNAASMRLVENMGFNEEGRIKDAHPCGDLIIYTLTRSACRFLGEKYGKRLKPTAHT